MSICMKLYIPNRIILVIADYNTGTVPWKGSRLQNLRLAQKLMRFETMYAEKGFLVVVHDYMHGGNGGSFLPNNAWPSYGFMLGGHGDWEYGILIHGTTYASPSDFNLNREYKFGLVYAFGCFQGLVSEKDPFTGIKTKWADLGSENGFIFISPKRPVFLETPTPKLPKK